MQRLVGVTILLALLAIGTSPALLFAKPVLVNIDFSGNIEDVHHVRTRVDEMVAAARALAGEAGIEKTDLQNFYYNVYRDSANGYGSPVPLKFNGNASFVVAASEDKLNQFLALLEGHGYNANQTTYQQCR